MEEKIKINDLKKLFIMIVEYLNFENIEEINLDIDMYRFIPADEWQSFDKEPIIGSLNDDYKELKKLIEDKDRVMSYVDFDRVANLLHYISEKQNPVGSIPFNKD